MPSINPRYLFRRTFTFALLSVALLALLTSSGVLASPSSSSSSSSSSQGERLEKRMSRSSPLLRLPPRILMLPQTASSAASIRFPQMLNEPRERGLTPGFVAAVVGGLSVVFAGLMV
ncbi:hypothetical protein B9Z19DRAFT_1081557 [Tuber borchii]|uniref:Transmembrane protein n=1 Tax=Tuber borchii TaxID=42251 RepID=A0A2T6ZVN4_TUBBO|nr:hypothetical protein B9Z19DRAFT_1081557 [Tuber borchii]